MSRMETVIRRVVKEDISNSTAQIDAVYEAIVNSIHAKSTHVICRFLGDQEILKADDEEEIATKKVVAIEVEDNGDGFTDENYKSFCKYRTDYKIAMGCRGVGRFVFLKLFENVSYISWLAGANLKREFSLSLEFDSDDLRQTSEDVPENKTILKMKGVTSDHFGRDRQIDRRLDLDLSRIREDVRRHLIPTFYFCRKDGFHVQIDFVDVLSRESLSLSEQDIPVLRTQSFAIKNVDGIEVPFELHYHIEGKAGEIDAFYCANGRSVSSFASQGLTHRGFKGILLLESEFLDQAVDNFRNDFSIYPIQTDMVHKLSWEMINRGVKSAVSLLVREQVPSVDQKNQQQLQEIQEERPYLVEYIEEEDLDIAGFVSKHQIIAKAKKRFDEAKDRLLANAGKTEYTNEELNEAIQLTQNELVAYIRDRIEVISRLKTMMINKEKTESVIHNLFMERFTDDEGYDCFSPQRNNLWLLDDRFTSYSYAASDRMIREVLGEDGSDNDGDRPDLALFFSQAPENKDGLKSVIVELKSFDDGKKYVAKKMAGINQLLDYADAFRRKKQIESVWAFMVTDVDERFASKLERDGYKPLFSTKAAIYHRYYNLIDTSIYVVSAQSLVSDAEARNRVFIDIINRHSRLERLLNGEKTAEPASL